MQPQRRRLRRVYTPVLAGLLAAAGLGAASGLTMSPAAAAAPLAVSLVVSTPETGAAANTLYVGQPVTYKATVTAGAAVNAVVFTDTLPADLAFGAADNPAWNCTDTAGALNCAIGNLAANTSSTATLSFTLSATTVLTSISFGPAATDSSADTTVPAADTANILAAADLSMTKTITSATTPPPNASPVVYDLVVNNAGPSSSGSITVSDRLSPGLSAPSTSSADPWACNTASLPTITCTLAAGLASGINSTITVSATGTSRVTDGASVTGAVFDPNPSNNSAPAPQGLVPYGTSADPGPCGPPTAALPPVRTCDLVAAAGTVTVPNFANPIPIWGFAIDPNPGTTMAPPPGTIPGPTLVANEGETLQLVVRNALPCLKVTGGVGTTVNYPCPTGLADMNNLAVQIPGITTSHTDDSGLPSGASTTVGDPNYTWTNLQPGTYVYEAGQTVNGARQLAMGLEGLLVVRPKSFTLSAPALFDTPPAAAPLHGSAPAGGPTTTSTSTPSTTGAPASTSTTTAPPATSTTVAPAPTSTTTAPPSTSTTPAPTSTVAPAPTFTTEGPASSSTVAPNTTTAAPAPASTSTVAPAPTSTTAVPTTTSTTVTGGSNTAAPMLSAPLLGAAAPSACTPPSTAGSGFTAEALVQVNELSSQFHANPFTSVMTPGGGNDPINTLSQNGPGGSPDISKYAPDVFLINGKAYPDTDSVSVTSTACVALHFANFGMLEKSFGVLDRRETIIADDSVPLAHPQSVATRYLNPGEEFDAVVDLTGSVPGQQFPIMDFEHHLHNGAGSANTTTASSATGMTLGGQLALLHVDGPGSASTDPVVSTVMLDATTVAVGGTPSPQPSVINMTATGAAFGGNTIAGGEWMIDTIDLANPGSGVPAPLGGATTASGAAAISVSALPALANGDHIIWVRLKDDKGNWSAPAGVVFTYDAITGSGTTPGATKCPESPNPLGGPIVCNLSLDPTVTNGSTPNKTPGSIDPTTGAPQVSSDMIIDGTVMPPLSDWSVTSFTWQIDNIGTPTSVPITCGGNPCNPGQTADLTTTIPAADLAALTPGAHSVSITATETQGTTSTRTGNPVALSFTMDTSGPSAAIASMTPNPASSASDNLSNLNYFPSVIIRGTLTPPLPEVTVTGGEMIFAPVCPPSGKYRGGACTPGAGVFLDPSLSDASPTPNGTGVELVPTGGVWNQPAGSPAGYNVEIPSGEFNGIPQGLVRVYVHGQDQSGQWGPWTHQDLVLDKTPPTISGATVTSPSAGHFMLKFAAQDPATVPACNNPPTNTLPNGCGGIAEQSGVAAVEWQISYADAVDNPAQNDFTVFRPTPLSNGPEAIALDVSGGPQPYPASFSVVFRVMDGAGNWTGWNTVTYP